MSLLIPPGFAQVQLPFKHSAAARSALCTFGIDVSDVGGDYEAAARSVMLAWDNTFNDYLDTQVTVGPAILRVGQDGGDPLVVEGADESTGGGGSASLPSNVALLVRKRTGLGGRRGRGRMYIPWIISDDSADDVGIISGAALPLYTAAAAQFLEDLATAGTLDPAIPMVLLHDSSGIGPEPPPNVVTSLTIDPMVGTQRRRLGR